MRIAEAGLPLPAVHHIIRGFDLGAGWPLRNELISRDFALRSSAKTFAS